MSTAPLPVGRLPSAGGRAPPYLLQWRRDGQSPPTRSVHRLTSPRDEARLDRHQLSSLAYRAWPSLGPFSAVIRTIPSAVTQKPAIRLGHGLEIGLVAAMTKAATARRMPATIHTQATARIIGPRGADVRRYRRKAPSRRSHYIDSAVRDWLRPARPTAPPSSSEFWSL